jgi:hypothetical protein
MTTIDEDAFSKVPGATGGGPQLPDLGRFLRSSSTVAELLQERVEDTDVDGFNLAEAVTPESVEDTVELLVPELQKRGVYKTEYQPGTLREKPRLAAPHPGAAYRDLGALEPTRRVEGKK